MKLKKDISKAKVNLRNFKKTETDTLQFAFLAANAGEEKKGENIILLDVSRLTIIADYFLIISAKSTPQIQAIAKHIEEELLKAGFNPVSREGFTTSWTVLDFGNFVVHIMHEREREYYKLERFWSNATIVNKKLWQKAS